MPAGTTAAARRVRQLAPGRLPGRCGGTTKPAPPCCPTTCTRYVCYAKHSSHGQAQLRCPLLAAAAVGAAATASEPRRRSETARAGPPPAGPRPPPAQLWLQPRAGSRLWAIRGEPRACQACRAEPAGAAVRHHSEIDGLQTTAPGHCCCATWPWPVGGWLARWTKAKQAAAHLPGVLVREALIRRGCCLSGRPGTRQVVCCWVSTWLEDLGSSVTLRCPWRKCALFVPNNCAGWEMQRPKWFA
jgi:hypothetical protein